MNKPSEVERVRMQHSDETKNHDLGFNHAPTEQNKTKCYTDFGNLNPHHPRNFVDPKSLSINPPQLKTQDIFQFFVFHRVLIFGDSIARRTHGDSGSWNHFCKLKVHLALLHFELGFQERLFEFELIG